MLIQLRLNLNEQPEKEFPVHVRFGFNPNNQHNKIRGVREDSTETI